MSQTNSEAQLRISEIFFSLQGETRRIGLPTVFVRLTGCPLRCTYCDTSYAFTGGQNMSIADILEQVAGYAPRYVCVTGGEPLAQKNCLTLLTALCDAGYDVSLDGKVLVYRTKAGFFRLEAGAMSAPKPGSDGGPGGGGGGVATGAGGW